MSKAIQPGTKFHPSEIPGEGLTTGMSQNDSGTWTALTHSASKTFKTERGAAKWLAGRGYLPNGERARKA